MQVVPPGALFHFFFIWTLLPVVMVLIDTVVPSEAAYLLECSLLLVRFQAVHCECPLMYDTSGNLQQHWTK